MHVVHLEDGRVEVSEESRPAVLEVLDSPIRHITSSRPFHCCRKSQRLNDSARFLRARSVIEINQGMPVRLLAQNRKVLAKGSPIQTLAGNLVHPLICYTRRQAPPYSRSFRRASVSASTRVPTRSALTGQCFRHSSTSCIYAGCRPNTVWQMCCCGATAATWHSISHGGTGTCRLSCCGESLKTRPSDPQRLYRNGPGARRAAP